jgi:quercetin dioxygenase-like cupin family protein
MTVRTTLYRWEDIALEKVTEMVSRKVVSGERQTLAQVYLKRGAQVPRHSHASEQLVYVLQGAVAYRVAGRALTVREGEVLTIPAGVEHQAVATEDTFELAMFSPVRDGWTAESGET